MIKLNHEQIRVLVMLLAIGVGFILGVITIVVIINGLEQPYNFFNQFGAFLIIAFWMIMAYSVFIMGLGKNSYYIHSFIQQLFGE